jgi:hypothetical protein
VSPLIVKLPPIVVLPVTDRLTGDVTGNADSATTSANLSFGSANQVVFKNGSNNGATSGNLSFDGTTLSGTALEIKVNDNKGVKFGTDSDMTILHDNTNGGIIMEDCHVTISSKFNSFVIINFNF